MEMISRSPDTPSKVGVFDIEADNLWYDITKVHCIWIQCPVTMNSWGYRPHEIEDALRHLMELDVIVAHNGIDYDVAALQKLYPWFKPKAIFDTMTLGSMVDSNRMSQSLDSWGRDLDELKGTFGKTADWSTFTEDMFTYCEQDVTLTTKLYKHLCGLAGFDVANPPSMKWD